MERKSETVEVELRDYWKCYHSIPIDIDMPDTRGDVLKSRYLCLELGVSIYMGQLATRGQRRLRNALAKPDRYDVAFREVEFVCFDNKCPLDCRKKKLLYFQTNPKKFLTILNFVKRRMTTSFVKSVCS